MAFRPIDSIARLWKERGLRYLVRETLDPRLSLLTYGASYPAREPPRRQPGQISRPQASRSQVSRPQAPRPQVSRPQVSRPSQEPAPEITKPPSVPQRISFPPITTWPKEWQHVAKQVKPGRIVWTYPLLGCDLMRIATTDVEIRRDFFRRIFQEKPLYPPKTHTFWPYALPKDNSPANLETNLPIFWAGVYHFQASALIVLGQEAGKTTVKAPLPYTYCHLPHGVEAMVFQDIATLRENANLYARMLAMVRTLLSRLGIYPLSE